MLQREQDTIVLHNNNFHLNLTLREVNNEAVGKRDSWWSCNIVSSERGTKVPFVNGILRSWLVTFPFPLHNLFCLFCSFAVITSNCLPVLRRHDDWVQCNILTWILEEKKKCSELVEKFVKSEQSLEFSWLWCTNGHSFVIINLP